MNLESSKFQKKMNNNSNNKSKIINFFNKILICFILVITCLIFMKSNNSFKLFIKNNVYQDNISFAYFNNLYNKYFGDVLPSYKTEDTTAVFNEKLNYKSSNIYLDGYKLIVDNSETTSVIP